jgi:hypothetical protein
MKSVQKRKKWPNLIIKYSLESHQIRMLYEIVSNCFAFEWVKITYPFKVKLLTNETKQKILKFALWIPNITAIQCFLKKCPHPPAKLLRIYILYMTQRGIIFYPIKVQHDTFLNWKFSGQKLKGTISREI